jgi:hypothetical protein
VAIKNRPGGEPAPDVDLRTGPTKLVPTGDQAPSGDGPDLRNVVIVSLAVLAGAALGAIGWAATHPDSGSTAAVAAGTAGASEVTVQCITGDIAGCDELVAQTVSDRCRGTGVLEVPGRIDDGTVRLTVQWVTYPDPDDLGTQVLNGGLSDVVDCSDV